MKNFRIVGIVVEIRTRIQVGSIASRVRLLGVWPFYTYVNLCVIYACVSASESDGCVIRRMDEYEE
jgi:hypothetical protein